MPSSRFRFVNFGVLLLGAGCLLLVSLDRLDYFPILRLVTSTLLNWVLLLGGFALLLGVLNVALVHLRRIQTGQAGWTYSLVLVATLFAVLAAGLILPGGIQNPMLEWVFDNVIAPGQAMLFALTAFFMAAAAFRWLRIGRAGGGWMLTGALFILFAQMPATNASLPPAWTKLADWLLTVPVMATLRGALLGSGLALILIGVRFFLGRSEA